MNRIRIKIYLVLLTLIVVLSGLINPPQAFSQTKGNHPGGRLLRRGQGQPPGPGHEHLQLSPEQKEKIQAIRNKYSGLLDDVVIEIRKARLEMVTEMKKDNPDRAQIETKLKKVMTLQEKRHQIILDEYFEIRSVLTPEQNRFFVRRFIRSMMREGEGKTQ
jgi:Spy/CpxP family protein refolding chaperone